MATYKLGVLGAFSGKLGNVVGTFWKGQNVMRTVSASYTDANTPAQQEARAKFALVVDFVSSIKQLSGFGFGAYDSTMTIRNAAFKYNYNAVKGVYPALSMDLDKVVLSKGSRAQLFDAAALSTLSGTIDITWSAGDDDDLLSDSVMAAVFDPATGAVVSYPNAGRRLDEAATLTLPSDFSGKNVTVMVFAVSDDALSTVSEVSQVSDTQNLGSVTVA